MSGHTPGPWRWLEPDERHHEDMGTLIRREDGLVILDLGNAERYYPQSGYLLDDDGQADANARLIAAAPELLEAAKHAAVEWRLHGQLTDSCRVLEAAIAKARGED